jgi:hypothetical protein
MKTYLKHLIECHCILQIFKKNTVPVYHKFQVFSELDDSGNIIEKYVACNNCEIIHFVQEACKSEILWGKEGLRSYVTSKDDIKFNLINENLKNIVEVLEKSNCDITVWEQVQFVLENKIENDAIVFEKETVNDNISYKYLEYNDSKFKIKKSLEKRHFSL